MNKIKSTKRAFLMSILSLVMCVSMLVGSTFAWFTDSVTSVGNKIQAGTLKIDLELLEEDGSWTSIKESKEAIFDYENWEPGYTEVKIFRVTNEGNLALKWVAKLVSANALTALADVIDVFVNTSATEYPEERNELEGWDNVGTLATFINTIEETTYGSLEAGEAAYLGLALKMQEKAGNEYQGMDLGGVFDIMIMATQLTAEEDSFDKQYDKDAFYTAEIDTFKANLAAAQAGDIVTLNLSQDAYLGADKSIVAPEDVGVVINGNGHTIYADKAVHVIAGKRGTNITINDLTIVGKTKDDAIISQNNGVGSVDIVMNNVTVDLSDITGINWPVCLGGSGTATLTNCVITGAGLDSGDYADGNQFFAGAQMAVTVVNSKIDSVMLNNGNDNGNVISATLNVDDTSEIGVVILEAKNPNVVSGSLSSIGSMLIPTKDAQALADALTTGSDVVLTKDVDAGGQVFVNKGATLDGNGKTITVNSGSAAYESGLTVTAGTVKNITVQGAFRGLGVGGSGASEMTGNVVYENVIVKDATYGINIGVGNGYNLTVINSTICDWNSYSGLGSAQFTGCTFTSEGRYYAAQRISAGATFTYTNCNFEQNTYNNAEGNDNYYLNSYNGTGTIVFENCYMDGVLVTAENVGTLFQISDVTVVVNNN